MKGFNLPNLQILQFLKHYLDDKRWNCCSPVDANKPICVARERETTWDYTQYSIQCQPSDRAEMHSLLTIYIMTRLIHKPTTDMYWSKDTLVSTPIFRQMMSKDKFLLMLRSLFFAHNNSYNANDQDRDKLYKLREVREMIRKMCSKVYYLKKKLSVHEGPLLFKERISFKWYPNVRQQHLG